MLYNYNYNQIQASEHVILYAYDVTVVCVIASVEWACADVRQKVNTDKSTPVPFFSSLFLFLPAGLLSSPTSLRSRVFPSPPSFHQAANFSQLNNNICIDDWYAGHCRWKTTLSSFRAFPQCTARERSRKQKQLPVPTVSRQSAESSCRVAKRLPKQTWSADAVSLLTGNANYLRESIVDTDVSRVYGVWVLYMIVSLHLTASSRHSADFSGSETAAGLAYHSLLLSANPCPWRRLRGKQRTRIAAWNSPCLMYQISDRNKVLLWIKNKSTSSSELRTN